MVGGGYFHSVVQTALCRNEQYGAIENEVPTTWTVRTDLAKSETADPSKVEPIIIKRKRKWSIVDSDASGDMLMPPLKIQKTSPGDVVDNGKMKCKPRIKSIEIRRSPDCWGKSVFIDGKTYFLKPGI